MAKLKTETKSTDYGDFEIGPLEEERPRAAEKDYQQFAIGSLEEGPAKEEDYRSFTIGDLSDESEDYSQSPAGGPEDYGQFAIGDLEEEPDIVSLGPEKVSEIAKQKSQEAASLGFDPRTFKGPYFADSREKADTYTKSGLSWVPQGKLLEEMVASGEMAGVQKSIDAFSQDTLEIVKNLKKQKLKISGYSEEAKSLMRERGQPALEYVQLPDGSIVPDYTDKETRNWLKKKLNEQKQKAKTTGDLKSYLEVTLPALKLNLPNDLSSDVEMAVLANKIKQKTQMQRQ